MPHRSRGPVPQLTEHMAAQDRIRIDGTRPGHPVLIRISYHPRWKALTGEKIWLAGPSFMLVFPRGDHVELEFGSGPPVVLGHVLTAIGLLIFLLAVLPSRRRLAALLAQTGERVGSLGPARCVDDPLTRTARRGPVI